MPGSVGVLKKKMNIVKYNDPLHKGSFELTLPQIRFSFVEGAPFHENVKPVDKQASGPHTNTLDREIKSPI